MAYDGGSGDDTFGQRLQRVLLWSFPIGRLFGVRVRVYGIALLVPLIAAYEFSKWGGLAALEVLSLVLVTLLPSYPLDGGRAFRSLLAFRIHPNRATMVAARIGYVGAAAFVAWGLFRSGIEGGLLVAIGISCALSCRSAILEARWGD